MNYCSTMDVGTQSFHDNVIQKKIWIEQILRLYTTLYSYILEGIHKKEEQKISNWTDTNEGLDDFNWFEIGVLLDWKWMYR